MALKHKIDLINGILAPQKHSKSGITHGFSENRTRTFFGGGHIGFCANRPLEGDLNLLSVVNVFIPITMQNFKNW